MADYRYSKDHAWVLYQGTRARVGLSDFAQSELGEISFVELPEVGSRFDRGEAVCSIDSLKSTSEIYAPVSGTIVEVNSKLGEEEFCTLINSDPLGEGWLFTIEMQEQGQFDELLTSAEYRRYLQEG